MDEMFTTGSGDLKLAGHRTHVRAGGVTRVVQLHLFPRLLDALAEVEVDEGLGRSRLLHQ